MAHPPKAAKRSGSSAGLIVALLVLLIIAGGGGFGAWWWLNRPKPPVPTAEPAPTIVAAATPIASPDLSVTPTPEAAPQVTPSPVEEVVQVVKPTPTPAASPSATKSPKPTPTPRGGATPAPDNRAQQAAQINALLGQAQAAETSGRFEAAAGLYDDVLKIDPQNSRASAGKAGAQAAAASMKRTFVAGRTVVRSSKAGKADMGGFDTADVTVAKAPDYSGVIEFEAVPARVKPGDPFKIKITLMNDGKKAFRIASVNVVANVNGSPSAGAGAPPAKDIGLRERVTIAERGATWQADTRSWSLEVTVTSNRGDVITNQLNWR